MWGGSRGWAALGDGAQDPTKEPDTPIDPTDPTGPTDPTDPGPQEPLATDFSWRLHDVQPGFAIVSWTQSRAAEVWVEYSVDPGEWMSSPPVAGVVGENEKLIVGIPLAHSAQWRIVSADDMSEAPEPIETGPIPADLPIPRLGAALPDNWLPDGKFMLTSISEGNGGWSTNGPFWTLIVDRRGRPVWGTRTERGAWTLYAQVSVTGDHIIYDDFSWFSPNDATATRTYLDAEIEVIDIPGFHHAFVELPDGTIAWASRSHGGGEALVERAPGEDDVTIVWTCAQDWPEAGGCASNCIYYNEPTDSYLYSFYSNESVVEVDRSTGETLWWAGGVGGGYSFSPSESHFYWQHGVSYTDEGTLLLSTHHGRQRTNLAREYIVDHDTRTLIEIWNYDAEAYADTNGDTWRLENGNTLHTLGSASEVKEVDANGQVVWHLDYEGTRLLGRSEFISDLYALLSPTAP